MTGDRPLLQNDHDFDGRPPVGWHDEDPLLAALIRAHPEMIPDELVSKLHMEVARSVMQRRDEGLRELAKR